MCQTVRLFVHLSKVCVGVSKVIEWFAQLSDCRLVYQTTTNALTLCTVCNICLTSAHRFMHAYLRGKQWLCVHTSRCILTVMMHKHAAMLQTIQPLWRFVEHTTQVLGPSWWHIPANNMDLPILKTTPSFVLAQRTPCQQNLCITSPSQNSSLPCSLQLAHSQIPHMFGETWCHFCLEYAKFIPGIRMLIRHSQCRWEDSAPPEVMNM